MDLARIDTEYLLFTMQTSFSKYHHTDTQLIRTVFSLRKAVDHVISTVSRLLILLRISCACSSKVVYIIVKTPRLGSTIRITSILRLPVVCIYFCVCVRMDVCACVCVEIYISISVQLKCVYVYARLNLFL